MILCPLHQLLGGTVPQSPPWFTPVSYCFKNIAVFYGRPTYSYCVIMIWVAYLAICVLVCFVVCVLLCLAFSSGTEKHFLVHCCAQQFSVQGYLLEDVSCFNMPKVHFYYPVHAGFSFEVNRFTELHANISALYESKISQSSFVFCFLI